MGKLGKACLFLVAVMLILTALSRAAASFTVAQVRVEQPQARRIIHTVNGGGIIEKMDERLNEFPVYAAADILVAEIRVREGQEVKKGDVLALLDMNSIDEKIQSVSDEIKELRLLNQSIAAGEQKKARDRNKAADRAKEDYDNTVSEGKMQKKEADERVEDAKRKVTEARAQAKKQADEAYEEKSEELREAVDAAKKEYDTAVGQEKNALLLAKRALEDASEEPVVSYDIARTQMEIDQKQSKIRELQRDMWMNEEGIDGIQDQIAALRTEIRALQLQLKEQSDIVAKQKKERERTVARAQEDYDNTVKKYEELVSAAKQNWEDAQLELDEFLEGGADNTEDASVKAAKEALKDAKQQRLEQARLQEENERQAKRAIEDSSENDAKDHTADINRLAIEQKERQLALLMKEKANGGKVISHMGGAVRQVQLVVGQKSTDTAAFLISDMTGGMCFTTQVSEQDAVYVMAGDTVTLKSGNQIYEELVVRSVEMNEDETVKVTVFVPGDILEPGAHADMELTKQSGEYGITVPVSAVHTENEKNFVYVMEPEETVLGGTYAALRVEVTVAENNGSYAAVTDSSLTAESQVITGSDQMISAGETVRLQEE